MGMRTNKTGYYGQEFLSNRALSTAVYLDQLSIPPAYVWWMKRKVSFATLCIRVRRSSDNAETDIGFVSNDMDTAALLTFCGANSGFVTKIYDQMGTGKDWVQTTTTKQPRIVNSGVLDSGFVFDGSNDFMTIASLTLGTPTLGLYHRISYNYGSYYGFFQTGAAYNTVGGFSSYTISSVFKGISSEGTGGNNYNSNQRSDTNGLRNRAVLVNRAVAAADEIKLYSNGVDLGYTSDGNAVDNTGNFTTQAAYLGATDSGASAPLSGSMEGMIVYTA